MNITLCSPTKYLKKCNDCLRRRGKPSEHQSYSNLYDDCKKYNYINFIEFKKEKK